MRPPQTPVDGRAGPRREIRWLPGGTAEPFDDAPVLEQSGRGPSTRRKSPMHGIIYLIGLIVVIMAILSFLGLR